MTPFEINFLLHCFTTPLPYNLSEVRDATIGRFLHLGLIEEKEDYYICTDMGLVYVDMLKNLPLPVLVFMHPDTEEILNVPNMEFSAWEEIK